MKVKLLHSFPDVESKFKEYCRLTFEINELENTYVSNLTEASHVNNYDAIVLHYLRVEDRNFLLDNKVDKPIIWFCWGGDIFNKGKFYNKFLLPKTKRLKRHHNPVKKSLLSLLKQLIIEIFPVKVNSTTSSSPMMLAIDEIDYIVPVMPGDYELIKSKYNINAELYHLNYVNPIVEEKIDWKVSGNNILLGNSATYSNNHIEAIDQLRKYNLKNRKIVIPLSYGKEDVADYIASYATEVLGKEKVFLLKDFLSFSKYNEILNTCEIVIMNQLRQQAVGNIVQSLINGSHLYLRTESTVYQFLKENDFKVSAFNNTNRLEGLSEDEILYNRKKAKKVFGAENQHHKLLSLMKKAIK